ncbi:phosphoglycerate mutase [Xylariomycetidae sp. FL2044]|nr:phosphoglycerate mutase [Xylariomycetidae sp. FL2044]
MAPIIHLVRHAEAFHNLSGDNEELPDPDLTPLGQVQCRELQERFPHHNRITHLVASPLRRTIHTCLLSFKPAVSSGEAIILLPDVQEVLLKPCDIGSDSTKLRAEFGDKLDYSLLTDGWNDKSPSSVYEPTPDKLDTRSRNARLWLRYQAKSFSSSDAQIVLVTHGGILHFLTQDWDGMDLGRGTGWKNAEFRSYEFRDPTFEDPEAALQETDSSWRQRRGSAVRLTETEQAQLRAAVQKHVEDAEAAKAQMKPHNVP